MMKRPSSLSYIVLFPIPIHFYMPRLNASIRPRKEFFMFPSSSSLSIPAFFFLLHLSQLCLPCFASGVGPVTEPARPTVITVAPEFSRWSWPNFEQLIGAQLGAEAGGLSELKRYLSRFGYLAHDPDTNFTDTFDSWFESAVVRYQSYFGLPATGQLDPDTVASIADPRCGVRDPPRGTLRFAFFPGRPRWARTKLTYAFSVTNKVDRLDPAVVRMAVRRAFGRWEAVIPISFAETADYAAADVKIGFYRGEHGDGKPFDGQLGILAHAFSPKSGRFHLDAGETWSVDFGSEESRVAVDLESVAMHEIGHVLGLAHSPVRKAVMYPSLRPRTRKVELSVDDVDGAQALYGSNPNFDVGSLSEPVTSGLEEAFKGPIESSWAVYILVGFFCTGLSL